MGLMPNCCCGRCWLGCAVSRACARWCPSLNLLSFVPFRLNRLAAEISNALAADYARFGIDIPEWRVLATLGMHDEARSANYVVRCTRTHKSHISRAVS